MKYTPSPALSEAAAYLSSASSLAKVSNTTKLEVEQVRYLGDYTLLTTRVCTLTAIRIVQISDSRTGARKPAPVVVRYNRPRKVGRME